MPEPKDHRLCVFCDTRSASDPRFPSSAVTLGLTMAEAGIGLVFAGDARGTMGTVAQAVKANGGWVTGVVLPPMPGTADEFAAIDERLVVADRQERKRLMFEISDGFVALPGGLDVLDALMEHLTWMQKGRHCKPVYLVNDGGYWDPLLDMFKEMRRQDFLPHNFDARFTKVERPAEAVAGLRQHLVRRGAAA